MSEPMACTELRPLIGALACDALEDDERALAERHLEACPECAIGLRELSEVSELLGATLLVDEPDAPPVPVPRRVREGVRDELAGRRATRRITRRRPSRRWLAAGAGALAGAAAASIVAVVVLAGGSGGADPVGGYDLNPTRAASGATGYAWVSPSDSGTELRVRAEGLEPTAAGERYRLLIASEAGSIDAGSFLVPQEGEVDGVELTAAVWLDDITSMRVVRDRGGGEPRAIVMEGTPAQEVPDYP